MTRGCVNILLQLNSMGAKSPLLSMTQQELTVGWESEIDSRIPPRSTFHADLRYLISQGYLSYGPSSGRSKAYYISAKGIDYLVNLEVESDERNN